MADVSIGVVVIGRNEGERLLRCLDSVRGIGPAVVYVDSASTDTSVAEARSRGAEVVELDLARPFTAGRARNEGFDRLLQRWPSVELVQFVDGDCEIVDRWIESAASHLRSHPQVVSVCGRRKERFPEASVYNALCDIEWNTPVGVAESTGGDFMTRAAEFRSVGGFNPGLIAGEEPELCYRIRQRGGEIHRIDALMTLHDAAMTRFAQWAKRTSRAGYAYAARAAVHWGDGSRYCVRENARIVFWALLFPAVCVSAGAVYWQAIPAMLAVYSAQFFRIRRYAQGIGAGARSSSFALFTLLSKWTELYGQLLFVARAISGSRQRIIEYK